MRCIKEKIMTENVFQFYRARRAEKGQTLTEFMAFLLLVAAALMVSLPIIDTLLDEQDAPDKCYNAKQLFWALEDCRNDPDCQFTIEDYNLRGIVKHDISRFCLVPVLD